MHILHLIASMDPRGGGPSAGIRNLIPALETLGITGEVTCLDKPDERFIKNDPFTTYALGPAEKKWCYSQKLQPWLLNNLHNYDAVLLHGLWLYPGYAVSSVIKKIKRRQQEGSNKIPKVFIMPHGMLDPYFQRATERRLKAVRNWLYWKLIERKVVNDADGIFFTCDEEQLLAKRSFAAYAPKTETNIGCAVEAPPALNKRMRRSFLEICTGLSDAPYLLYFARIHEKKGIDLLLNAFKTFKHETINRKAALPKIVIAGPGIETTYGQKIRSLTDNDPFLKSNVFFTGMLAGDAKWGALYGCEALVLPSHQENFGIAVVEALACCKPVLISDKVNIWREINAANAGIIKTDSLTGVVELLSEWFNTSPQSKRNMGFNAANLYHSHFNVEQAASRFKAALC
ncbi:glycosyltransferase [Danxiaibacter flavus]|uniref:Glycosyltransferase n=1 Tax=Danxiaibacter flavus TaxID=3049108 RepID=A0ABV3ZJ91_9BACT|nr:glycosyltransferase [Chitinophagaceae bacterium DXS]